LPSVSDPAVKVENLEVSFRTTADRPSIRGLGSSLPGRRGKVNGTVVEALRGISFDVQRGSVYGVIGRNGAGKSTMFRAVAGILSPTGGQVTTSGRVTPLLTVGLGFNRELSGYENILLGGLALGLKTDEVKNHHEEIVQFSELGPAIMHPMRTYSSGMFSRLAFSVATHLDPEIVLIDEALSAGDAAFKKKSQSKILDMCSSDTTVMIVSHGLEVVKNLADRALWLDKGLVKMEGTTEDVIGNYLEHLAVEANATSMEDM